MTLTRSYLKAVMAVTSTAMTRKGGGSVTSDSVSRRIILRLETT